MDIKLKWIMKKYVMILVVLIGFGLSASAKDGCTTTSTEVDASYGISGKASKGSSSGSVKGEEHLKVKKTTEKCGDGDRKEKKTKKKK